MEKETPPFQIGQLLAHVAEVLVPAEHVFDDIRQVGKPQPRKADPCGEAVLGRHADAF